MKIGEKGKKIRSSRNFAIREYEDFVLRNKTCIYPLFASMQSPQSSSSLLQVFLQKYLQYTYCNMIYYYIVKVQFLLCFSSIIQTSRKDIVVLSYTKCQSTTEKDTNKSSNTQPKASSNQGMLASIFSQAIDLTRMLHHVDKSQVSSFFSS